MGHDVFISHATEDQAAAGSVCDALEAAGVPCWIAPRDIPPGTDYVDGLMLGIGQCAVLLLVFTAHSNASPWVKKELERANSRGLRLLPVMLEQAPPSPGVELLISGTQWFDATRPPLESRLPAMVAAATALVRTARAAGAGPAAPAAAPILQYPAGPMPGTPRRGGRTRWWVAGGAAILLAAAVAVGATMWLKSRPRPAAPQAGRPAGRPADSRARVVNPDDPNQRLTSRLLDPQDFSEAATVLSQQMLSSPRVARELTSFDSKAGQPLIKISRIKNDTGLKINMVDYLVTPIEQVLVNSGKANFVSEDAAGRDIAAGQEILNGGRARLPDFVLFGTVSRLATADAGVWQNAFIFQIRLTRTADNTVVFVGSKDIAKQFDAPSTPPSAEP